MTFLFFCFVETNIQQQIEIKKQKKRKSEIFTFGETFCR